MNASDNKIGQLFMIGFPGAEPSDEFLQFIAEEHIGGVILFEENCPTHEVARENIETIRAGCRGTIPLIAIDQEGGRVCRLRGAPAEYRAAGEYGRDGQLERFQEDYTRSAVFMASLGINLNLGPVCDIRLNEANDCLKDRCFGTTADAIVPFVEQAVQISRKAGLLSCLKHFPGLGAAAIDPHRQTATADYDDMVWEQREMIPFLAGVEAGADMVMTTHLKLPKIDALPATGSAHVVDTMIRKRLDFDGPVVTDDLLMAGAGVLGHVGERAVAAFVSGHDLLLFGRDMEETMRAYDYFVEAVADRGIMSARLRQALGRISGMKFKLDSPVLR